MINSRSEITAALAQGFGVVGTVIGNSDTTYTDGDGERFLIVGRNFRTDSYEAVPLRLSDDWEVRELSIRDHMINGWPWKPYLRFNNRFGVKRKIHGAITFESLSKLSDSELSEEDKAEAQKSIKAYMEFFAQREAEMKKFRRRDKQRIKKLQGILEGSSIVNHNVFLASELLQRKPEVAVEDIDRAIQTLESARKYLKRIHKKDESK